MWKIFNAKTRRGKAATKEGGGWRIEDGKTWLWEQTENLAKIARFGGIALQRRGNEETRKNLSQNPCPSV
jgi:hypothetical protein